MDDNTVGISLFQGAGIKVENTLQNLEEAEDLEDQKRRQTEIKNLLTKAMDEFNYDEQSTINSSGNVSIDESYNKFDEKYKSTSYDDQLKVLYEVRVREVRSLAEQLENLKAELTKAKESSGRRILILEAENEKTAMSLKQSQALVVGKNEEITATQIELSRVNTKVKQLEETLKKVIEEKETCECLNKDLLNQLSVMHTGITTNTISNRQIHEQYHAEVSQLHAMLDAAHIKIQRKENECKELQQNFKEKCNEKDDMVAEKCSIINSLTESLENAQQQCQELLQIIEKISQENKTLKLASTRNELTDSVRIMGLADKTEMVKALQKELEKTREVQRKQQAEFEKLQQTCTQLSENFTAAEYRIEQYKSEISLWTIKNSALEENLTKRNNELQELSEQLTKYKRACAEQMLRQSEEKVKEHESANKNTREQCIQVSEIFNGDQTREKEIAETNEILRHDLKVAHENIEMLKHKLSDADEQISKMSMTVSLEIERDKLIKTLQEKAAQFERIITEKHYKPEYVSVGMNTEYKSNENQQKSEILQAQYEADLIQKEIQLRVELQSEYDAKFSNLEKKVTRQENVNCNQCDELLKKMQGQKLLIDSHNEELNTFKLQRQEDRDAVANLVEEWRDRLIRMEMERNELYTKYLDLKNYGDELALKLKTREDGESKLYAIIKRECEETIKLWNREVLSGIEKYTMLQQSKFQQVQKRINDCTNYYDKEVHEIEMQFLRKKEAMEHSCKS